MKMPFAWHVMFNAGLGCLLMTIVLWWMLWVVHDDGSVQPWMIKTVGTGGFLLIASGAWLIFKMPDR